MSVWERVRAVFKGEKPRFPVAGGRALAPQTNGTSWLTGLLPGTSRDWAAKVGDRWRSSATWCALNWIIQSFPEARLQVCTTGPERDRVIDHHPLTDLLAHPNPAYSANVLWTGTLISFLCDGNAYWLKIRSSGGQVEQLWYIPHFQIAPQWAQDGSAYIDRYAYTVNGVTSYPSVEDVVHFRYGINPRDIRRGISPWAQVDRWIATDNEQATYHAALLENMGVPGILISPAPGTEPGSMQFDEEGDGERIKKRIGASTTGDRRFEPVVIPAPIHIDKLGFSPEEMALERLVDVPAAFVFAAIGLDPMVAGLPSESKTYANYHEAMRGGWTNCVLPTMAQLADAITTQLLPDIDASPNTRVVFDTSDVTALQEDQDALVARLVKASGGPVMTPNEARLEMGLQPIANPEYDVLRAPAMLGHGDETDVSEGNR